jgi:hypothetical protein
MTGCFVDPETSGSQIDFVSFPDDLVHTERIFVKGVQFRILTDIGLGCFQPQAEP